MKFISTTELQRKDEFLLAILGNRGLSWHDDEFSSKEQRLANNWAYNKAQTIAGGTSEIHLNIIAKRAGASGSLKPTLQQAALSSRNTP